jgi:hypothetical protein
MPVLYGYPSRRARERVRRGDLVLGGCLLGTARWHCPDCFNSWPKARETYGVGGTPASQKAYLAEKNAEYARIVAGGRARPLPGEPFVLNYWARPHGRTAFLLAFPWGRLRVEKRLRLIPAGGPPVYEATGANYPEGADLVRINYLAAVAALRFERRGAV